MSIAVAGVDRVVAACDAVAAALVDPATATDAAGLVSERARPNVPRVTGHLASTEQVTPTTLGAALEWTAAYAVAVHTRRPWLPAAIVAAETAIVDLYTARITAAWS